MNGRVLPPAEHGPATPAQGRPSAAGVGWFYQQKKEMLSASAPHWQHGALRHAAGPPGQHQAPSHLAALAPTVTPDRDSEPPRYGTTSIERHGSGGSSRRARRVHGMGTGTVPEPGSGRQRRRCPESRIAAAPAAAAWLRRRAASGRACRARKLRCNVGLVPGQHLKALFEDNSATGTGSDSHWQPERPSQ